ncbi:unnamed protein product [Ectocarpus sp. 8 AP-2014]
MTFEEASMPEYVLREVLKQGFPKPTPIQSQGWPMALLGRDMVGISATGSGKTLAFLLPAMIHINAQVWQRQHRHNKGPPLGACLCPDIDPHEIGRLVRVNRALVSCRRTWFDVVRPMCRGDSKNRTKIEIVLHSTRQNSFCSVLSRWSKHQRAGSDCRILSVRHQYRPERKRRAPQLARIGP